MAVGAFDAHMGAVGGCITDRTLVKIMGTSTCDMLVAPSRSVGKKMIPGICGQVDGSVIPGMVGLEAGQSAFGDVYAWFKDVLSWPVEDAASAKRQERRRGKALRDDLDEHLLDRLAEAAEKIDPAESTVAALDWLNGRRTPFADQTLKGAIVGLTLGTTAPRIFRALVEATAFGSLRDRRAVPQGRCPREGRDRAGRDRPQEPLRHAGDRGRPGHAHPRRGLRPGLRAGRRHARRGGRRVYPTVADAQKKMGSGFDKTFTPNKARTALYRKLYERYTELGRSLEPLLRKL